MLPHRPQQQSPIDTVKEAFDIKVQDPIILPTSLTSDSQGLNRRLLWPIPVGVRMEIFLQNRLQVSFDYRLGNAVCDRRNPQRPHSPIVLRYIDPTYRRRKIAARGHPIPDLEEIVLQIHFKV